MAYRELELTLQSAQELKNVNLITRMDVYAVVSISGNPLTRQCTEPDIYGGRNPCWDATFRFAVPPTAAAAAGSSLHVLLRAERFLGDRDVGEVVIPLADILASATGAGPQPPQAASYQVLKLHRWEPRGVLNVSYRLGPVVAPVGVLPQPSTAVAPPATGAPVVRVVANHDEAAQNKSPVMALAYPVAVPQQQASHPPAKPDAYRPPSPPPPRPAAVHAARHEEAPPLRNGGSNGLGQPGPTHVYMGPHTQIIFSGGAPTTTTGGLPTWTTSPARSIISPAGKNDVNWALLHETQRNYASAAESMAISVISPRTKEDRWRPSVFSQSQHDTQQQQQAASSSSFSSPLSPYSSAQPSPSSSSAHSSHGAVISSPLHSSSPMVPNHSRGSAVSSPLPPSSPLVPKNSTVVPSL